MKIGGIEATRTALFGPVTFKRGDQFLAFFAQPVWDFDEFHALCPAPTNEFYRFTKNGKEQDPDAPAYREALGQYARKRWGYMVLKSLEPSKIEWDTVNLSDPSTWGNVEDELRTHLAHYEFGKVMTLIDEANAIDEEKLAENAKSFFQQRAQGEEAARPILNSGAANS